MSADSPLSSACPTPKLTRSISTPFNSSSDGIQTPPESPICTKFSKLNKAPKVHHFTYIPGDEYEPKEETHVYPPMPMGGNDIKDDYVLKEKEKEKDEEVLEWELEMVYFGDEEDNAEDSDGEVDNPVEHDEDEDEDEDDVAFGTLRRDADFPVEIDNLSIIQKYHIQPFLLASINNDIQAACTIIANLSNIVEPHILVKAIGKEDHDDLFVQALFKAIRVMVVDIYSEYYMNQNRVWDWVEVSAHFEQALTGEEVLGDREYMFRGGDLGDMLVPQGEGQEEE